MANTVPVSHHPRLLHHLCPLPATYHHLDPLLWAAHLARHPHSSMGCNDDRLWLCSRLEDTGGTSLDTWHSRGRSSTKLLWDELLKIRCNRAASSLVSSTSSVLGTDAVSVSPIVPCMESGLICLNRRGREAILDLLPDWFCGICFWWYLGFWFDANGGTSRLRRVAVDLHHRGCRTFLLHHSAVMWATADPH